MHATTKGATELVRRCPNKRREISTQMQSRAKPKIWSGSILVPLKQYDSYCNACNYILLR